MRVSNIVYASISVTSGLLSLVTGKKYPEIEYKRTKKKKIQSLIAS